MALGDRIRYFRKLRGLTQQELGEAIGFSSSTADVRIGQYETNIKKPRQNTLLAIAEALGVNVDALIVPDISSIDRIMHTLFLMEDELGLSIQKGKGFHYYIDLNTKHTMYAQMEDLFSTWHNAYNSYLTGEIDLDTYNDWRYKYPNEFLHGDPSEYQRLLFMEKQNAWNLKCQVIQTPTEGVFKVGNHYSGRILSASSRVVFPEQLLDQGFAVKDGNEDIYYYSMTDFPTYFKIQ